MARKIPKVGERFNPNEVFFVDPMKEMLEEAERIELIKILVPLDDERWNWFGEEMEDRGL